MTQYLTGTATGYTNFLDQWPWECHITLTWPKRMTRAKADFQARNFINRIQKKYRMKLSGAILVKQDMSSTHAHLSLLSNQNYPCQLEQVPSYKLKQEWHHHAKVTKSDKWSNTQLSHYIAKKENIDLNNPDEWDLTFYRKSNLQKLQN